MANKNDEGDLGFVPHNKRFPQQWEIISRNVDFNGRSLIDLGCGGGDMIIAANLAGANAHGVDYSPKIIDDLRNRLAEEGVSGGAYASIASIDNLWKGEYDIAVCFSVLPYVKDPQAVLSWMRGNADISLIEVQYIKDGPGTIKDDEEMGNLLHMYWEVCDPIGKTLVDYRRLHRTIWMCEKY